MLLEIPDVLSADALAAMRSRILERDWQDGRITAGHQSARAKRNRQLGSSDPVANELGAALVDRLGVMPQFVSAAVPKRIFSPLFARYGIDDRFDTHVDNAIRYGHGGSIRTDLSATLFLSAPANYDGGGLVIEDQFGPREIRLAAGNMVLYPSSSLHHVEPVTRGERLCVLFWIQSLVRDDGQRRILFDLDRTIQSLACDLPDDRRIVSLTGTYHNLLRRWAEL